MRANFVPGSVSHDSYGRVLPKNSNTVPDLILDLSRIFWAATAPCRPT
jgi:hypothetical protein